MVSVINNNNNKNKYCFSSKYDNNKNKCYLGRIIVIELYFELWSVIVNCNKCCFSKYNYY